MGAKPQEQSKSTSKHKQALERLMKRYPEHKGLRRAVALAESDPDNTKLKQELDDLTEQLSGWGGARPNSGRPELPKEEKASEKIFYRIKPAELRALTQMCQEGESPNQAARRILLEAIKGS